MENLVDLNVVIALDHICVFFQKFTENQLVVPIFIDSCNNLSMAMNLLNLTLFYLISNKERLDLRICDEILVWFLGHEFWIQKLQSNVPLVYITIFLVLSEIRDVLLTKQQVSGGKEFRLLARLHFGCIVLP